MKLKEVIRIAWEAILKNKARSFLTMLGIIIGVAAVIIMVAISAGTEATIQDQITSLGTNLLFIQSSFTGVTSFGSMRTSGGLVFDDAAAIADNVKGVKSVVVEQSSEETVKYEDVTLDSISILGIHGGSPLAAGYDHRPGAIFQSEGSGPKIESCRARIQSGRGALWNFGSRR